MKQRLRTAAAILGAIAVLWPLSAMADAAPSTAPTPTGTGCAWPFRLDPTVANTLYPDSAASFWITPPPAVPGETLTISGQFPYGRYMSLTPYTPYLFSIDGLHDSAITADAGS